MSDREISSESMDFFTGLVGLEDRTGTFHGIVGHFMKNTARWLTYNFSMDWFKGKCTGKPLFLMGKSNYGFRFRFSLKPIHWIFGHRTGLCLEGWWQYFIGKDFREQENYHRWCEYWDMMGIWLDTARIWWGNLKDLGWGYTLSGGYTVFQLLNLVSQFPMIGCNHEGFCGLQASHTFSCEKGCLSIREGLANFRLPRYDTRVVISSPNHHI